MLSIVWVTRMLKVLSEADENKTLNENVIGYLHTFQGAGPRVFGPELVVSDPNRGVSTGEYLSLGCCYNHKPLCLTSLHNDLTVV